tara:strand:- start:1208 stop:1651 length:444 start_codon:yes stop_codon:yes gene_type:complete
MSFIGFALAMAQDTSFYLTYGSIQDVIESSDQTTWELLETKFDLLQDRGINIHEVDGKTINKDLSMRVSIMYIYRSILDVLALLGVSMMFIRLKLGFVIYAIFQAAYAVIPFVMFGTAGGIIVGNASIAITLVYIALFLTQKRHLIR